MCDTLGGTYQALMDKAASALTVAATTGGFAVASSDLAPLSAFRFVKIVASQIQAADRKFQIVLKQ